MGNKFTEEDKKNVIEFLNLVAKNAKFTVDTTELINYFKTLAYMQKVILPKIDANILEIKKVVQVDQPEEKSLKKSKG